MHENKVRGNGMLQAVTHFYFVAGSPLVNLSPYDTWSLIFLIIMTYFVKAGQYYELADYMKKHEIVNKIKSRITRIVIKVSKYADKWTTLYYYTLFNIFLFFCSVKDKKNNKNNRKNV